MVYGGGLAIRPTGMIRLQRKSNRDSNQQRRDEINGLLNDYGLRRERRSRVQQTASGSEINRLRDLLQVLGPVFASFGLYLASRPDLLSLSDCVTLASISDRSNSTAPDTIRQIIEGVVEGQTNDGADQPRIVKFDPEPFESRLLFQLHYGELENGDLVVVKIVHPTIQLDQDISLLPLIAHAVAPQLTDSNSFHDTVASFGLAFRERVNCQKTAESLETLALDTRDNESLCVPKVYHELCTEVVLVTERLDGVRLDHYVASCGNGAGPGVDRSFGNLTMVPDELARLLCDAWLHQTFQGTMLPVDIRPENILLRSPTEIAILDGLFVSVPAASRRNLLSYFIAVATDEPSKALTCLLKELDGTHCNISPSALDRQFRQLVAFRDGGWEDGGRANCLSDTLFAQWRLVARDGFRPLRHATHFFRGTFHITLIARQVAPDRDSLLEGVKDLRLTKLLNDIGTMMEPSYWGGQMDRLASLMILGPQQLDDALKTISDGEQASFPSARSQHRVLGWNPLLIALLALAASFLFRDQLAELVTPAWAERLTALVFVAVGGLALQWLTTSGES